MNFLIFSKWYIYNIQQHRAEVFYTCSHSIGNRKKFFAQKKIAHRIYHSICTTKKNWLFIWLAINFFRSNFFTFFLISFWYFNNFEMKWLVFFFVDRTKWLFHNSFSDQQKFIILHFSNSSTSSKYCVWHTKRSKILWLVQSMIELNISLGRCVRDCACVCVCIRVQTYREISKRKWWKETDERERERDVEQLLIYIYE